MLTVPRFRTRSSTATRVTAVAAAFAIYALARALVASAYPWQRAFDDFFFLPETSRWLAAGRLGSDATFTRVPLWHLMLGAHLALFGRYGVLVLQAWIVLAASVTYSLWLDSGWRRSACWAPLVIFLLSPQILLYSRQAVNELFVGLLTLAVMVLGERRGRRAALSMGALVGLAVCTKLVAGLLGIVALGYALRDRVGMASSLARTALGFCLVAVPLLAFAGLQRESWLLDNTSAFNLSGMTLEEWRALPDAATRHAVGMARWWETFSGRPGGYLAGAGLRALDWLLRPSSADFALFYPGYPLRWIVTADAAAFAILIALGIVGSSRRDAFVWLYCLGWVLACAFPVFTPRSPKVILMFPALLLAARGVERLIGEKTIAGGPVDSGAAPALVS